MKIRVGSRFDAIMWRINEKRERARGGAEVAERLILRASA
jgi:hypothetical protein